MSPAVSPPQAMVKATDETSWSAPWVIRTARLRLGVSAMVGLLKYLVTGLVLHATASAAGCCTGMRTATTLASAQSIP